MFLLDTDRYDKAAEYLKKVPINQMLARSVAAQKTKGRIYVDDPENPGTFYIIHPYGMSWLLGSSNREAFNDWFMAYALNKEGLRNGFEWMQAYPAEWNAVLNQLFGAHLVKEADNVQHIEQGIIELNTRVNFRFNKENYVSAAPDPDDPDFTIQRTNQELYHAMRGSVVPMHFWNSAEDFLKQGGGFCLFYKDELAATAFSSCVHDHLFEIGIETVPAFRGRGYAEKVCSALIDDCLAKQFEPVWACRLENTGSYRLALRLGFEPFCQLPYYRLSR